MMLKVGRNYLDPMNRTVLLLRVVENVAVVKLYGSYGATVFYPISCLRSVP